MATVTQIASVLHALRVAYGNDNVKHRGDAIHIYTEHGLVILEVK